MCDSGPQQTTSFGKKSRKAQLSVLMRTEKGLNVGHGGLLAWTFVYTIRCSFGLIARAEFISN